MASLFSVSGLSTGIDTKTLVEQLISADRAPARLIEAKRSTAQVRLEAVKQMNTQLLAMRDAMDDLELGTAFGKRTVTSSNETVLTATTTDDALPGSTTLTVKHLASAHQLATTTANRQSSATVAGFASGSITVQSAGAAAATVIPITDYSLNGIATAINGANAGVKASVFHDGVGYRLLVSSTKTGADQGITQLQADGDLAGLLPGAGSLVEAAPARNAQVMIGDPVTGLEVESASNAMDQVLPGVSLTLKAAGTVDVTVSQAAAEVRSAAQKLADTFNTAVTFFKTNGSYNATTKKSGPLFADYDLKRQLDQVEDQLGKSFAAQPTGFKRLADIGVKVGSDGKMTIDAAIFDAKVTENQDAVSDLFRSAGAAASVPLEDLTRSVDGAMALKQSTLENNIASFTERVAAYDVRLEQRKAFYTAQFLTMEKITAQLQSQGNAMTNFANSLTKSSK